MYCTESWIFLKCFLITECVASSQECREDPNVSPHTAFSLGEDEVVGEEGDCSIQRCQRAANSCWPHICCALSPGLFGDETQAWLTRGKPVIGASVLCRLWAQLGPTAGWVSPSVSMVSLQTRKSGALQKHLDPLSSCLGVTSCRFQHFIFLWLVSTSHWVLGQTHSVVIVFFLLCYYE